MAAYCMSTREAMRLTYRSTTIIPRDCASKKPASRHLPEAARGDILGLAHGKAQAQVAHLGGGLAVVALDHAQHHAVEQAWGFGLKLASFRAGASPL